MAQDPSENHPSAGLRLRPVSSHLPQSPPHLTSLTPSVPQDTGLSCWALGPPGYVPQLSHQGPAAWAVGGGGVVVGRPGSPKSWGGDVTEVRVGASVPGTGSHCSLPRCWAPHHGTYTGWGGERHQGSVHTVGIFLPGKAEMYILRPGGGSGLLTHGMVVYLARARGMAASSLPTPCTPLLLTCKGPWHSVALHSQGTAWASKEVCRKVRAYAPLPGLWGHLGYSTQRAQLLRTSHRLGELLGGSLQPSRGMLEAAPPQSSGPSPQLLPRCKVICAVLQTAPIPNSSPSQRTRDF